jgi:hypothetical protein
MGLSNGGSPFRQVIVKKNLGMSQASRAVRPSIVHCLESDYGPRKDVRRGPPARGVFIDRLCLRSSVADSGPGDRRVTRQTPRRVTRFARQATRRRMAPAAAA